MKQFNEQSFRIIENWIQNERAIYRALYHFDVVITKRFQYAPERDAQDLIIDFLYPNGRFIRQVWWQPWTEGRISGVTFFGIPDPEALLEAILEGNLYKGHIGEPICTPEIEGLLNCHKVEILPEGLWIEQAFVDREGNMPYVDVYFNLSITN